MSHEKVMELFSREPRVVNIGVSLFAKELSDAGARVVHLEWSPPASAVEDPMGEDLVGLLDLLDD